MTPENSTSTPGFIWLLVVLLIVMVVIVNYIFINEDSVPTKSVSIASSGASSIRVGFIPFSATGKTNSGITLINPLVIKNIRSSVGVTARTLVLRNETGDTFNIKDINFIGPVNKESLMIPLPGKSFAIVQANGKGNVLKQPIQLRDGDDISIIWTVINGKNALGGTIVFIGNDGKECSVRISL